ncbi:MAG: SDR family NAD(P)-dependent oxidoreductase [Candidatus Pacebacteria bacterium]|nr:SDR family NAD(P)-dependent oxidoreductase [Candidatus Paceibacterota bacterium]
MTKQILVTGADGFIGSHLVEALIKDGHKVRAFCLYNSFNDIGWLKVLEKDILENIDIVLGDIRDFDSIRKATDSMDVVFHLAALIAIPYSYTAPESYIDTNIKGTLNVLRAAIDKNIEQVIHTSTSEVYGTAQYVPITEQHPLVGQSPYAASKIGADQIAHAFYCSYGLPVSTVRPFNTFGPRQSSRAVIPTIMNQVLSGQTSLNLGNVNATRDFNFVYDTVRGMIAFLGNQKTFGEVINLGTGVEVTIREVVQFIAEISGAPLEIKVDTQRIRPEKSEVERLCASNLKANEILDFSGIYPLKKGLEITYDWFKNNREKYQMLGSNYII